jgi:hypothetical protein
VVLCSAVHAIWCDLNGMADVVNDDISYMYYAADAVQFSSREVLLLMGHPVNSRS